VRAGRDLPPTGYGPCWRKARKRATSTGATTFSVSVRADFALIKAERGDRWGNLVYRKTARNFGPLMATAAKCTIAQVREVVPLGGLDPEAIITPGIFVKRVVQIPARLRAVA
jgi:3-oxoadipate CoA-transferase alpha subunit